ncbi:MAG: hypothetical protein P4L84_17030 [Isosphaeraceae bacterium]|nr:hypothetical protein [Isosphaeraceae bacterium]
MRRPLLGFVLVSAFVLLAPGSGWAQTTSLGTLGSDPFATYFGWYLPNQAYQASQPRVEDTINAITVVRQRNAIAERDSLFDTRSRFDLSDEDELGRYAPKGSRGRPQGGGGGGVASSPFAGNVRGTGPALYYSRTGRYFPTLRAGHGPNRNVAVLRSPRGMGMGGGMGAGGGVPGGGMPGPR